MKRTSKLFGSLSNVARNAGWKLLVLLTAIIPSVAISEDKPDLSILYNKATGRPVALINNTARPQSDFSGAQAFSTLQAKTKKRSAQADNQRVLSAADAFLSDKLDLLGINSLNDLHVNGFDQDRLGIKTIRLSQTVNGVPVYGSGLVVTTNQADEVLTASGALLPNPAIDTTPKINARRAINIAKKDMERRYGWKKTIRFERKGIKKACRKKASDTDQRTCLNKRLRKFKKAEGFYSSAEPKLYVYNEPFTRGARTGDSYLAWNVTVTNSREDSEHFMVDATKGSILMFAETKHHDTTRKIYDCTNAFGDGFCWATKYSAEYNYTFGRVEGAPPRGPNPVPGALFGSTDLDYIYDLVPDLHSFYEVTFLRNGANNIGGLGDCSGNSSGPCSPYNETRIRTNLNGTNPLACTPGGALFQWNPPSINLCRGSGSFDLLSHEYAHAVARLEDFNGTTFTSLLTAGGQSGALNESNSDVMGESFEKLMTGTNDWEFPTNSTLATLRALHNPASLNYLAGNVPTPYPDRFNSPNFYCGGENNGGVHENSTVPSHGAYLAAEGGTFNGCTIEGIGLEKVEQIWYRALTTYYTATTSFNQAYFALNQACQDLAGAPAAFADFVPPFTITPADCEQVMKALQAVELDQAGFCSGIPGTTPACAAPQYSADFDFSGTVDLNDYQILRGRWSYPNEAARLLSAPPEGDANLDGTVDIEDYNIFVPQFINDNPGVTPPPAPTMVGDLNLDGVMNIDDYIQWLQSQGQTGPGLLADTDVNGVVDNTDLQMWASHYPTGNPADLNNDSVVDLWDYNAIRAQWNDTGAGLSADINNDGLVGVFDYEVWFYLYNQIDAPQAPTIPGDYNLDGQVDAVDYTVWRNNFGNSGPAMGADGNGDGMINAADYTVWRDNLGATVEPPALLFYPGDCDLDGDVDGADFMSWQRNAGGTSPSALACDFNGDLVVDGADLDLWRANYGNGAG